MHEHNPAQQQLSLQEENQPICVHRNSYQQDPNKNPNQTPNQHIGKTQGPHQDKPYTKPCMNTTLPKHNNRCKGKTNQ